MSPFKVYCDYMAIRKHFKEWSYDYFRYNGKMRIKPESFEARRDRYFFEKLERHRDPRGVLVVAMAHGPDQWIGSVLSAGVEQYDVHRGRMEALSRTLRQDLELLPRSLADAFEGDHPRLVRLVMGERVSMETATLLVDLAGARGWLRRRHGDDPIIGQPVRSVVRLGDFLQCDREKVRGIFLEHFVDAREVAA